MRGQGHGHTSGNSLLLPAGYSSSHLIANQDIRAYIQTKQLQYRTQIEVLSSNLQAKNNFFLFYLKKINAGHDAR